MQIPGLDLTGASYGSVPFGGLSRQSFNPEENEDKNIWASASVGSVNGAGTLSGGTTAVQGTDAQSGEGLVARLDRMDASLIKPQHQNEFQANKLDMYA